MAGIGTVDISELTLRMRYILDLYVVPLYLCTAVLSLPTLEDCSICSVCSVCSIHRYHYYYNRKFYIFYCGLKEPP